MEKEINIAAILKDKPETTNLYSPALGKCELVALVENGEIIVSDVKDSCYIFNGNGVLWDTHGELMLFPSKEMRNWNKFAWKKGDVLVDETTGKILFFYRFTNEDYTEFSARYELGENFRMKDDEDVIYKTKDCHIASSSVKKEACSVLYRYLPSEAPFLMYVEKPQFKDGDIVAIVSLKKYVYVAIYQMHQEQYVDFHAVFCYNGELLLEEPFREDNGDIEIRLATDSEKQQLFDALAKDGKRWNSERKQIEDLPKMYEFKPLDYVLLRLKNWEEPQWQLFQYAYETDGSIHIVGSAYGFVKYNTEVLPYNEETAHLLGTTDDWKGGEG